jgi:uncharacterized protein YndB with AHSA1/START domain
MYTVVVQRQMSCDPDVVWAHLSQPPLVARWFADVDRLAEGEAARFDFGDGDFHSGTVTEWNPGISLGVEWRFLGVGPRYQVRYSLLGRGRGTELSVQDRGAPTEAEARCLRVGWHEFLSRLQRALASNTRTRFVWRPLISFTLCVEDAVGTMARLADDAWYRSTFPAIGAVRVKRSPRRLQVHLDSEAPTPWRSRVDLELTSSRGRDFLFGFHRGWNELRPPAAIDARRLFVQRWCLAFASLPVT